MDRNSPPQTRRSVAWDDGLIAPRVLPPKGAPNVLLIITDDAGFGVPSTFGLTHYYGILSHLAVT
jgi:hypothetical protein